MEKQRWERQLDNPEKTVPVYLTESALRNLKYNLGHLTAPDYETGGYEDLDLSEAITKLGTQWIVLGNQRLSCERRHLPFEKLIAKKLIKKHRTCTVDSCKLDDWELCPVYEY